MEAREEDEADSILRYLMEQQQYQQVEAEEFRREEFGFEESPEEIEHNIQLLVGHLITNVEAVVQRSKDYVDKLKAHNQYMLFNMKNIIKDFKIDDDIYERITFREALLISHVETYKGSGSVVGTPERSYRMNPEEAPQPMGGICIDVQMGSGSQPFKREAPSTDLKMIDAMEHLGEVENASQDNPRLVPEDELDTQRRREMSKILVHVSSDFDYYSKNGGSRITTWLDRNLHTLEELRREYVMVDKTIIEEKLLLTLLKPYKYYVKHQIFSTKFDNRKMYMLSKAKDYISEGSNFVLMRYLAIKKYFGTFELSCMYINGDMCRNIYECKGLEGDTLNGVKIDICRINRTIIEECGIEHKCITVLTTNGQIIKQEWENCNFILHVNPLLKITNDTPPGNDQVLLRDCWINDMQLMSRYLDEKSTSQIKMRSYLLDQPEIKKIVHDYIQELILSKPSDIIDYTIQHFLNFAPEFLPRYDYV